MKRDTEELQSETAIQTFKAWRDARLSYQIYSMNILNAHWIKCCQVMIQRKDSIWEIRFYLQSIYTGNEASKS